MLVVCAPYSPIGASQPNLGAARKLESYLMLLSRQFPDIILINTAHNCLSTSWYKTQTVSVAGVNLTEITLPTIASRPIGKLLNLALARTTARRILELGTPSCIWLYNAYAFECLLGLSLVRRTQAPLILEFEDWHFARQRPLAVKPVLDHALWRALAPHVTLAACVNDELSDRMRALGRASITVPGIVPSAMSAVRQGRQPFNSSETVVGYFGGFNDEKGSNILLDLPRYTPNPIRFVYCGSGPALSDICALEQRYKHRVQVYTGIEYPKMLELMETCDVLINPHIVTSRTLSGVFPSKVLEALGSGRLVLSTKLPKLADEAALRSIYYCAADVDSFAQAIVNAKDQYSANTHLVRATADWVAFNYGEDELLARILSGISVFPRSIEAAN